MKKVFLKEEKKKSVLIKHPWIFSAAIERIEHSVKPGDIVEVCDRNGKFLAKGYINPKSQITIRILTWQKDEDPEDRGFIEERLKSAIDQRLAFFDQRNTDSFRLVNSEADFIPGLIVDKYRDVIVVQFLTAGIERFRERIISFLVDYLSPKGIYERSDSSVRKKEGLGLKKGILYGNVPERQEILENGIPFLVDVKNGQKTGFYLDQRDNRREILNFCKGKKVLNCFSYTGAFSVYALKGGAEYVMNVEISKSAVDLSKEIMELNELSQPQDFLIENAFDALRKIRKKGMKFDLIILDPPKFAHTHEKIESAIRGYKDINLQAMKLLEKGGILFTFSCSGAISLELFSKIITWSAMDARRQIQVIKRLGQPIDHPHLTSFLESEYLKGLICRVY